MQALLTHGDNTVFSKTAKGRQEISERCNRLSPSGRRMLILIDGSKDVGTLTRMSTAMLQSDEFAAILTLLIEQEFIAGTRPDGAAEALAQPAPVAKPAAPPPGLRLVAPSKTGIAIQPSKGDDDPEAVQRAKAIMTTAAQTYLGLLGANLIERIGAARDATQLMSLLGHWHMALRDSKHGGRAAADCLEQVQRALGAAPPLRRHG